MKKVERYFYPAVFTYGPGQEIAVVFPDLNCAASGMNDDDALPAWLNDSAATAGLNFSQVLQDALKAQLHVS